MGKASTRCGRLSRFCLLVLHLVSLIACTGAIAVALWAGVDKEPLELLLGSNLHSLSSYLLVTVGFITLLHTFIACLGALKEIKCLILLYVIVTMVLFISVLTVGILVLTFKAQIRTTLLKNMRTSQLYYYGDSTGQGRIITRAWDFAQEKYSCCGTDNNTGLAQWKDSVWYRNQVYYPPALVPETCCITCSQLFAQRLISNELCLSKRRYMTTIERRYCHECMPNFESKQPVNPSWCRGTSKLARPAWPQSAYIHTRPCYELILSEATSIAVSIGSLSLVLAFIMVLSMLASLFLHRDLYQSSTTRL